MLDIKNPIGGYFELELPTFNEFHSGALSLNSGRFCLEYILKCRRYKVVYIPYFTCDSVLEPIVRLGITYKFYHIDYNYHIVDDIMLSKDEALLYTNYWGLQSDYCLKLKTIYKNQLILDYTQAFFAKPISGIDTFYSCRKFFGVPDGGYLYSDAIADFDIERDQSYMRIDSLVKRIDLSPTEGYPDFIKCSKEFKGLPIRYMSKFTKRMMSSIDYNNVAKKRRANYNYLLDVFGGHNLADSDVPMVFPYLVKNGTELRKYLINSNIFIAKYWPNVDKWVTSYSVESNLSNNLLPLPIDQRYGINDMQLIVELINNM